MSDLKKTLMKQGMKLMSDPRVAKMLQDPRVMSALMQAMSVPGKHVLDASRSADDVLQEALWIVTRAVAAKAQRTLPPVEAVSAIGSLLPNLATV